MGKKRIAQVGFTDNEKTEPKKPKAFKKKTAKTAEPQEQPGSEIESSKEETIEKAKTSKPRRKRIRSGRYKSLVKRIDKKKIYPLSSAVKLLTGSATVKFDESVELHLNVRNDKISGSVKLPHGTGKTQRIVIWNEKTEKQVKEEKIDFDVLLAKPSDMAIVAKYAKLLGPKGLMPNPKNKTISENPEEALKKLGQEIHFKTEKKNPLIHALVGKISMGEKKLSENIEAFIGAVDKNQILKITISSSMGPGIKIAID